jgi:hypothetical protein
LQIASAFRRKVEPDISFALSSLGLSLLNLTCFGVLVSVALLKQKYLRCLFYVEKRLLLVHSFRVFSPGFIGSVPWACGGENIMMGGHGRRSY